MSILFWVAGVVGAIAALYVSARVSSIAYFRTRHEYDQRRAIRNYFNRSED
jgi:hypothetical protein